MYLLVSPVIKLSDSTETAGVLKQLSDVALEVGSPPLFFHRRVVDLMELVLEDLEGVGFG